MGFGKCCCPGCDVPGCDPFTVEDPPFQTKLTVSGNHPATLYFDIEYVKTTTGACEIDGNGPVIEETSTGEVWEQKIQRRHKLWDEANVDIKLCCGPSGFATPVTVQEGRLEAFNAVSQCYYFGLRYDWLRVRVYAGTNEGVCGVWVWACLGFRRKGAIFIGDGNPETPPSVEFIPRELKRADYRRYDVNCWGCPPTDEPTGDVDAECIPTWNDPEFDPDIAPSAQPHLSYPDCTLGAWGVDGDFNTLESAWAIARRKFIPLADTIGPLTITLGPTDNQALVCGSGSPWEDGFVTAEPATAVYFVYITYADFCDLPETWTCNSINYDQEGHAWAAWAMCDHINCAPGSGLTYLELEWLTSCATIVSTGGCLPNDISLAIAWSALQFCDPNNWITYSGRARGSSVECTVSNNFLLWGEEFDTWTLEILPP